MMTKTANGLDEILALPTDTRVDTLVKYAGTLVQARDGGWPADAAEVDATVQALLAMFSDGTGTARQRLALGEVLGHLGDPRVLTPADDDYWVGIAFDDGIRFQVGRFLVTNQEFRAWVEAGGLDGDEHWSEEGLEWRSTAEHTWLSLASVPDVAHLTVANQPVVGVSWYEAEAFARAHGARLLTSAERRWVTRGAEKRPYPWGAPFGEGKANTREEALGRPCAVGLYLADRTPEGVHDLAGNTAEWTADGNGAQRVLHPGSWARPSMASWAKALDMAGSGTRSADLGFRLARG